MESLCVSHERKLERENTTWSRNPEVLNRQVKLVHNMGNECKVRSKLSHRNEIFAQMESRERSSYDTRHWSTHVCVTWPQQRSTQGQLLFSSRKYCFKTVCTLCFTNTPVNKIFRVRVWKSNLTTYFKDTVWWKEVRTSSCASTYRLRADEVRKSVAKETVLHRVSDCSYPVDSCS